jgi:alpha-N-arabinofuranosidase
MILKLVNPQTNAVSLNVEIKGVTSLLRDGSATTLAGKPEDTNSITQPRMVVPVTSKVRDVKPIFAYKLPPSSIVVLKLKTRS